MLCFRLNQMKWGREAESAKLSSHGDGIHQPEKPGILSSKYPPTSTTQMNRAGAHSAPSGSTPGRQTLLVAGWSTGQNMPRPCHGWGPQSAPSTLLMMAGVGRSPLHPP